MSVFSVRVSNNKSGVCLQIRHDQAYVFIDMQPDTLLKQQDSFFKAAVDSLRDVASSLAYPKATTIFVDSESFEQSDIVLSRPGFKARIPISVNKSAITPNTVREVPIRVLAIAYIELNRIADRLTLSVKGKSREYESMKLAA